MTRDGSHRVALRAIAALGAALFLVARPVQAQPAPVAIDVIINLTGSNAFIGGQYATALRVLEQYVNRTGGIGGRPLRFTYLDDQTSVANAVQLAQQAIARNPALVIGAAQTATCAAIAPFFANGPVDYCLSTAYTPQPGSYVFASSAPLMTAVGPATVRFMRLQGWKRIAVINATDATGQASDRMLAEAIKLSENRDLTYVATEHFNPTDLSVAAQVQRIVAARPDAVLTLAGGSPFGTVLHGLADAGVALPVVTSGANLDPGQMEQYRSFLPPALYFNSLLYMGRDALPPGKLRDGIDAFYAAYKAAGQRVTPASGFAWDPGWIAISALRKLGANASAEQIHQYLEGLHDFEGVDGVYDFRGGDQHGLTDAAVMFVRWDAAKGDFVVASKPGGLPLR